MRHPVQSRALAAVIHACNAGAQLVVVAMLSVPVASCGGGMTSSGAAADTGTGDIAGIYSGDERVSLIRDRDQATIDKLVSPVSISVSGDGRLTLTSGSGTRGEAQITNNRTFRLRADARTHFSGACSAGTVILEGQISAENGITGRYRSDNLACAGEAHVLEGGLGADKS